MFDHIINWRLLRGSHKFPGPDGGTCINEAAIVAAGFKYRCVESVEDMPKCFSRVISAYALGLNDSTASKEERQKLLPFVLRLAGTTDKAEVEAARAKFIVTQILKRIISVSLYKYDCHGLAEMCEAADLDSILDNAHAPSLHMHIYIMAKQLSIGSDTDAVTSSAYTASIYRDNFEKYIAILDEAILMGRHGDIDNDSAFKHLEKAKALILERVS
jgi:hypothetical protein